MTSAGPHSEAAREVLRGHVLYPHGTFQLHQTRSHKPVEHGAADTAFAHKRTMPPYYGDGWWMRVLMIAAVCVAIAGAAMAQFRRPPTATVALRTNIPYDGRFTFVRLNYTTAPGGYFYRGEPAWAHGYPLAEQNLMAIMNEVSLLGPHINEINSLRLDDPALSRYPIAYVIEPDWWTMTDSEVRALRDYLQKGGFLIVDDFKGRNFRGGGGWEVFERNMKRAFPQGRFVDLDISHPIFHSFFEIKSLNIPQAYVNGDPVFRGLFEENDPAKRLQIIVNFNTDISQFWEWSGTGLRSISDTNESYKLGVNYLIYGLTH